MKGAAVLAIAACSRAAPLASCDDGLGGVYVAGGERWMIIDRGATLEAYPLFPDNAGPPDLVVAPRMIDLERGASATGSAAPGVRLAGTLWRRYMRRAERCDAHVAVHVTSCAGDTLELVLADPVPPIAFSPCLWPRPAPSRVERWRRE